VKSYDLIVVTLQSCVLHICGDGLMDYMLI